MNMEKIVLELLNTKKVANKFLLEIELYKHKFLKKIFYYIIQFSLLLNIIIILKLKMN